MTNGEENATLAILIKHGVDREIAKDILNDLNKYREKRSLDCKYAMETPLKNQDKTCIFHYSLDHNSGAVTFTHMIKEDFS